VAGVCGGEREGGGKAREREERERESNAALKDIFFFWLLDAYIDTNEGDTCVCVWERECVCVFACVCVRACKVALQDSAVSDACLVALWHV